MSDILDHLIEKLGGVFGGKRWIVATDVLAAARGTVEWLDRFGAEAVLCVAAAPGVGPKPSKRIAPEPIVFDIEGEDMMSSIRQSAELLANLPVDACAKINAFDPVGTAKVIGTIYDDGSVVGGRRKFGARPRSWQALEDKTTVDMLWDSIRVPRCPSRIVLADDFDALHAASKEVDEGDGTVWAADSREGFHGGASFTRHVRTKPQMRKVYESFIDHADHIRVMPFLEGIPCSIHGFVFADHIATFRPCEMLVLRRPDGSFHYGGAATFWDPPDEDREAMRGVARRTGEYVSQSYGYRGVFTIDGVMTTDGFRPTELNPRFGAAMNELSRNLDFDLPLFNLAVIDSGLRDWRADEFEQLVLESADQHRAGGAMAIVSKAIKKTKRADLVFDGDAFRLAKKNEQPHATAIGGPHPAGTFVRATFEPEHTPVGESCATRAAAALAFLDAEWKLGLGPLEPAADVRQ